MFNNKSKVTIPFLQTGYWESSSSGTDEWYFKGAPIVMPLAVKKISNLTRGTVGTLADQEWGFGDNDSLGYDTIYFRNTADPASTITYSAISILTTAGIDYATNGESYAIEIQVTNRSQETIQGILVLPNHSIAFEITAAEGSLILQNKFFLNPEEEIKILLSSEEVSVMINGDNLI